MRSRPTLPALFWVGISLAVHSAVAVATRRSPPAPAHQAPGHAAPLAGDTFDVESVPLVPLAPPAPPESPGDDPAPAPGAWQPRGSPASAAPRPPAAKASRPDAPPPLFGAVGERFATDLATAFTRAFPQVASADPSWSNAAPGTTSAAQVALVLDGDGHLAGQTVGGAPSSPLRRGIERTLALLRDRAFTARAATTKLRVTAHVSRDDVHDGLHGDVFALSGGSFSGDVGTAFFALPPAAARPGLRVDVSFVTR